MLHLLLLMVVTKYVIGLHLILWFILHLINAFFRCNTITKYTCRNMSQAPVLLVALPQSFPVFCVGEPEEAFENYRNFETSL